MGEEEGRLTWGEKERERKQRWVNAPSSQVSCRSPLVELYRGLRAANCLLLVNAFYFFNSRPELLTVTPSDVAQPRTNMPGRTRCFNVVDD